MRTPVIHHVLPDAPEPRGTVTLKCEVTPGNVQTVEVPELMLERFVAVKMVPVDSRPGVFRAQVKQYARLVPVTDDLGDRMGWGLERRQILALAVAGMIDAFRATTGTTLVDPVSVWEHIYRTRLSADTDRESGAQATWTPEAVRHYSDSRDFVRTSGIVTADRRKQADKLPHLEFDFGDPPA